MVVMAWGRVRVLLAIVVVGGSRLRVITRVGAVGVGWRERWGTSAVREGDEVELQGC